MKIQKSKRAFTLLEIAIAIFILSLIGSVVSWQVSQLISSQRFQRDGSDFSILLQEAQALAIIHQTDFEMRLILKNHTWAYQLFSDEPLKIIDRAQKELKETHFVTENGKKCKELTLKIFSSGRIEPHPLIGFHRTDPKEKEGVSFWIDLQIPIQIKCSHLRPVKRGSYEIKQSSI